MKGPSLVEVANLREILITGNDVQGFGFFFIQNKHQYRGVIQVLSVKMVRE